MAFNTAGFLFLFFPAAFLLYRLMPGRRTKNVFLAIASALFYGFGGLASFPVLFAAFLWDYLFGRLIAKDEKRAKLWCGIAAAGNLALLGFYKYLAFVLETLHLPALSQPFALPLGISFFTFHGISYLVDVYREPSRVCRRADTLFLYLAFFPRLIAGPIVRYGDIAPALDEIKPDTHDVFRGVCRFARGLGKKVLISNYCAAAVAALDALTGAPALTTVWARALLFTLQIYFDFSGYSDMAIGLGRMLGFDFPENFNYPFVSASATEFWRRWHISLSSWFRDYLFYPVLRSRAMNSLSRSLRAHGHKKAARAAITVTALLCVWSATGLWHGASWNYVLWGLYYFVLLTLEMFIQPHLKKHLPRAVSGILAHIYFALITVFGMAIFSSESNVFASLGRLLGIGVCGFSNVFTEAVLREYLYLIIAALLLSLPMIPALRRLIYRRFGTPPAWLRAAAGTLFVIVTVAASSACLVGNTYNPFLYFRF